MFRRESCPGDTCTYKVLMGWRGVMERWWGWVKEGMGGGMERGGDVWGRVGEWGGGVGE